MVADHPSPPDPLASLEDVAVAEAVDEAVVEAVDEAVAEAVDEAVSTPLPAGPAGPSSRGSSEARKTASAPLARSPGLNTPAVTKMHMGKSYGSVNPRQCSVCVWGLMHPLRFVWNIFFVNRSIVTIFYIAFRPSFLRNP